MKRGKKILTALFSGLLVLSIGITSVAGALSNKGHWVASWGSGMTDISVTLLEGKENWDGITISPFAKNMSARVRLTPTLGGDKVQFRLSNENGRKPLVISDVSIARAAGESGSTIVEGTSIPVTFGGERQVTIPAGEIIACDPIDMEVTAFEDLCVSYYIENFNEVQTMGLCGATTYLTIGNHVADTHFLGLGLSFGSLVSVVPLLSDLYVYADSDAYSVVVIGDSTTSNDIPELLARRIADETGENKVGVVQKSIIGNSMLMDGVGTIGNIYGESLISRYQEDALDQPGVRYTLVKIGLNDLLHPRCKSMAGLIPIPTVDELVEGYRELIRMSHEADVKIVMAEMSPWKGYTRDFLNTGDPDLEWSQEAQDDCDALTQWIRATDELDGSINLDCLKDPNDPTKMPDGWTEDGAHLLAPAQEAFVNAIDLSLFGVGSAEEDTSSESESETETPSEETTTEITTEETTAEETNEETTESTTAEETTESTTAPETESTTGEEKSTSDEPVAPVVTTTEDRSDTTTRPSTGNGFGGISNVDTGDSLVIASMTLAMISAVGILITVKKK